MRAFSSWRFRLIASASVPCHGVVVAVGAADGFPDDLVDDLKLLDILRGQLERLGGLRPLGAVGPEDGGAPFGGDDRVDGEFQHQDPVSHGDGQRPAGAPLAGDNNDDGSPEPCHLAEVAGDGLGLAPLFGADAGKGAGGIHEGDDGELEPLGHLHEAERLAVPFGIRHPEVAVDLLLGIVPLLVADDHDRFAVQARRTADDGMVVAEEPVAVEFGEVGKDPLRYNPGCRGGWGDAPPGRSASGSGSAKISSRIFSAFFSSLAISVLRQIGRDGYQLLDLLFQFDYRLFKFEVKLCRHRRCLLSSRITRYRYQDTVPAFGLNDHGYKASSSSLEQPVLHTVAERGTVILAI